MQGTPPRIPLRWIAVGVFVLSSSLNYMDRQLLAALAPTLRGEFQWTNQQYGLVVSAFAMVYALAAPAAGWFIDRVGLNRGATISVALWSLAGSFVGREGAAAFASVEIMGWGAAAAVGEDLVEGRR